MKKYTIEELTEIFSRHDNSKCLYTEEDRQRVLNNPEIRDMIQGIKRQYEDYISRKTISQPFTAFKRYAHDGDRKDGEYWYYYNRRKMNTIAIVAWLYQEKEQIAELEDILWAIMDEYVWNIPAHIGTSFLTDLQQDSYTIDLFSADTGFVISEILALLGNQLEPIIHKRASRLIDERCFDVLSKPFFWKEKKNNWSGVISGQIGMTAIRMKNDPAELAKIIHECLKVSDVYISSFPEDGTCREGLGYWGYGMRNYTYFADLLYRRTEGEINLFDNPKIKEIAKFQRKCFFPSGKIVTFSDSGGVDSRKFEMAVTMKLHEIYPEIPLPPRELVDFGYSTPSLRALLWAPLSFDNARLEPDTFVLPDAQWYISSCNSGLAIAAKAGYNWEDKEPHNHNDVGNFHVYKGRANLIPDIGGGVYNGKYFDPRFRYRVFACNSAGHNVPIINGKYQQYGEEYHATDVNITKEDGLIADIAGAYAVESLKSLKRYIRLDAELSRIYLRDEYKFDRSPESVVERFISYAEPKITDNGIEIVYSGQTLLIKYDKTQMKPKIDIFYDKEHLVRHRDGFKVYLIDLAYIGDEKEFTLNITME